MLLRSNALKSLCALAMAMAVLGGTTLSTAVQASTTPAKTKKAQVKKAPVKKAVAARTTVRKASVARAKAKAPVQARRTKVMHPTPKLSVVKARSSHLRAVKAEPAAAVVHTAIAAPSTSLAPRMGLRDGADQLDFNSNVALVIDQQTQEVLFSKNDHAVLPIASLTKLMTGLVVVDEKLDMNEPITITRDDIDTLKGSGSRLAVGTTLTRGEMMHLALMSSENRAANALGRTYPGGLREFVRLMNAKAAQLGMHDTRYVEPTGLSSDNRSSARDLATLVSAAYERPMLRDLSTSPGYEVDIGRRTLQYNNSNRLVKSPDWDIGLQKTGYISEAGRCLVMQARVAGRQLIMVFLDATGKLGRLQDAERVRRWVETRGGDVLTTERARPQG
jgi:D-alanyl-D-alanine endopeptidase (penicillin-binding protein 7)